MTASDLKRKLAKLGCEFANATNHTVVTFQGRKSVMPRHPSAEVKTGTLRGILKQLGIKNL
jgi:mRNA interferase HicA